MSEREGVVTERKRGSQRHLYSPRVGRAVVHAVFVRTSRFAESRPRYGRVWADVPQSHIPYVSLLKLMAMERLASFYVPKRNQYRAYEG